MANEKDRLLYVSLYISKTRGSSFRQILEQKFGDKLQSAYIKGGKVLPYVSNPGCIHGHVIFKYFIEIINKHKNVKWITFLRDPFANSIGSHCTTELKTPETTRHLIFLRQS